MYIITNIINVSYPWFFENYHIVVSISYPIQYPYPYPCNIGVEYLSKFKFVGGFVCLKVKVQSGFIVITLLYWELAFGLVAKAHGFYMRGHGFETQMGKIICYNNKGIK
jgi:hypothetical protein